MIPLKTLLQIALLGATAHISLASAAHPAPTKSKFPVLMSALDQGGGGIIVGEIHGTEESPKAFTWLVDSVLRDRGHVLVLLESTVPSRVLAQYVSGQWNGDELATALRRASTGDGRHTTATAGMLHAFREWCSAGRHISIASFNSSDAEIETSGDREAALASSVNALLEEYVARPALIFTGNIHAQQSRGVPWDENYEPMAARLGADRFINLEIRYPGGMAQVCRDGACSAQDIGGFKEAKDVPAGTLKLEANSANAFDGALYVGKVTAAKPCKSTDCSRYLE